MSSETVKHLVVCTVSDAAHTVPLKVFDDVGGDSDDDDEVDGVGAHLLLLLDHPPADPAEEGGGGGNLPAPLRPLVQHPLLLQRPGIYVTFPPVFLLFRDYIYFPSFLSLIF